MKCPTGKVVYESEELGLEALIQNHIRNNHRQGSGPINVYQCGDCKLWHFTSQGEKAAIFLDEQTKRRIQKEQQALEWERNLR